MTKEIIKKLKQLKKLCEIERWRQEAWQKMSSKFIKNPIKSVDNDFYFDRLYKSYPANKYENNKKTKTT